MVKARAAHSPGSKASELQTSKKARCPSANTADTSSRCSLERSSERVCSCPTSSRSSSAMRSTEAVPTAKASSAVSTPNARKSRLMPDQVTISASAICEDTIVT